MALGWQLAPWMVLGRPARQRVLGRPARHQSWLEFDFPEQLGPGVAHEMALADSAPHPPGGTRPPWGCCAGGQRIFASSNICTGQNVEESILRGCPAARQGIKCFAARQGSPVGLAVARSGGTSRGCCCNGRHVAHVGRVGSQARVHGNSAAASILIRCLGRCAARRARSPATVMTPSTTVAVRRRRGSVVLRSMGKGRRHRDGDGVGEASLFGRMLRQCWRLRDDDGHEDGTLELELHSDDVRRAINDAQQVTGVSDVLCLVRLLER